MTDDEKEKFDAIRMNLELTSHDLESMRERMESMREGMENMREPIANLAAASADQRKSIESHERETSNQFADIRDSFSIVLQGTQNLLVVSEAHNLRILKLEGRI